MEKKHGSAKMGESRIGTSFVAALVNADFRCD